MERGCWIPGFKNITERMSLFRVKKIPFVGFGSSYPRGRMDLQTLAVLFARRPTWSAE